MQRSRASVAHDYAAFGAMAARTQIGRGSSRQVMVNIQLLCEPYER
jgi:hypothetical protein